MASCLLYQQLDLPIYCQAPLVGKVIASQLEFHPLCDGHSSLVELLWMVALGFLPWRGEERETGGMGVGWMTHCLHWQKVEIHQQQLPQESCWSCGHLCS